MRYLAIDLGDKRTGIAVGVRELCIAHPVCVLDIPIGEPLIKAIVSTVKREDADELVIGLPINMDGSLGQRAELTKAFAQKIAEHTALNIHFQDERLTSSAAEEKLAKSGKTHKQKKKIRDALAAAEILQDFLQSLH